MAITRYHHWISSDGDFNNVASWANNIVPVLLTDCALLDGVSQQDVTTNLARGAAAFQVRTTPEYKGNIGSPGNYLAWTPDPGASTHIRGRGSCYFQFAGGQASVIVESKNSSNALTFTGSTEYMFVKRGRVNATSTAAFEIRLFVCGSGAHVVIDAAAGAETMALETYVSDGLLENARADHAAVVYYISGQGRLRQTELWHAGTNVRQAGGAVDYWPSSQTARNIKVYVEEGRFDLTRNQIAILTSGIYFAGEKANILAGPADTGGVPVTWDMREYYP